IPTTFTCRACSCTASSRSRSTRIPSSTARSGPGQPGQKPDPRSIAPRGDTMPFSREDIARRAAQEIAPGSIVNLGIGLPTLVADYVPPEHDVWFHSENGLLGMGPFPYEGDEDPQLINAGKQT